MRLVQKTVFDFRQACKLLKVKTVLNPSARPNVIWKYLKQVCVGCGGAGSLNNSPSYGWSLPVPSSTRAISVVGSVLCAGLKMVEFQVCTVPVEVAYFKMTKAPPCCCLFSS